MGLGKGTEAEALVAGKTTLGVEFGSPPALMESSFPFCHSFLVYVGSPNILL